MQQVIPVSDGRKILGKLIDIAKYQQKVVTLGRRGKPEAFLIAVPGSGDDFSMTELNAASPSFSFLVDEPELYSRSDIKTRYA